MVYECIRCGTRSKSRLGIKQHKTKVHAKRARIVTISRAGFY